MTGKPEWPCPQTTHSNKHQAGLGLWAWFAGPCSVLCLTSLGFHFPSILAWISFPLLSSCSPLWEHSARRTSLRALECDSHNKTLSQRQKPSHLEEGTLARPSLKRHTPKYTASHHTKKHQSLLWHLAHLLQNGKNMSVPQLRRSQRRLIDIPA